MGTYAFHRDEKKIKEVLTKELYDNDLIVESLRSNFLISTDFNSLDIQRELFKMLRLDEKFNTLEQIWAEYDKKYGGGQDEFKSFDEFAEAVRYIDLETQRAIYHGFAQNIAVAIRNNNYTQENMLKVKCLSDEKYLKKLETEGDNTAFEEFCACLDIDYEKMTEQQIELVGKFFDSTMLYAEKLVKKEEIEFIKRYVPFLSKLEQKLKDRLCVSCKDVLDLITKSNPSAKPYAVYDKLTDKQYYMVDMSGGIITTSAEELMKLAIDKDSPIVFIGGVSDKINAISGKTICNNDKPSYFIDINLTGEEYKEFYFAFLNYFINHVNFKDYKGFVNDMLEWGPLFVGFSDFNKFVNIELFEKIKKDKIATKIGVLLKNPKKLELFLKKNAQNYRKVIDKIYKDTIIETKKYSNIVTKYKPEEIIPFAEF